jgi:small-conductance mechanosensitive channel
MSMRPSFRRQQTLRTPLRSRRVALQRWKWVAWSAVAALCAACCAALRVKAPGASTLGCPLWRVFAVAAGGCCGTVVTEGAYVAASELVENSYVLARNLFYFVLGTRKPMRRFLRALAWCLLINTLLPGGYVVIGTLRRLSVCLAISCGASVATATAAKVLASDLHTRAHFGRLQDALDKEFVVNALFDAEGPKDARGMANRPHDCPPTSECYGPVTAHRMQRHVRKAPMLSKLGDPNAEFAEFPDPEEQRVGEAICAKLAAGAHDAHARRSVDAVPGRSPTHAKGAVQLPFVLALLPAELHAKLSAALDPAGSGLVADDAIRAFVRGVYEDRRNLTRTMTDTNSVVGTVRLALGAVLQSLLVVVYMIVFGLDVSKLWLTISSVIVATSVVFGLSIRVAFDSFVFLYVVHPYDVGDSIVVEGEPYVVDRISWMTTVAKSGSGELMWLPNIRLASCYITNQSRSSKLWDGLKLSLDIGTGAEALVELERRVKQYLSDHRDDFTGACVLQFDGAEDPMKVRMSLSFEYRFSGAEWARKRAALHGLLAFVSETMPSISARYSQAPKAGVKGANL